VIESKPDNEVHDLRLSEPWPELAAAAAAVDLDALDDAEHSHVPYGLLLVKAAAAWKEAHDGQLPNSSTDRAEFKDMIRSWQRKIDDCPIPEENYGEAIASAHKVWAPPTLSTFFKD
jgi:NEDD8-activating enzyme E1 regulatory subunit